MTNRLDLIKSQELAQAGVIYAPASFLNADINTLVEICNGCGAAGSWFRPPERIYGTLISYACQVHDFMYEKGFTEEDRCEADRVFLNNINRLITRDSHKWYKPTRLQRIRAIIYYKSVKYGGGESFWRNKN
jgi:hypothetical protein